MPQVWTQVDLPFSRTYPNLITRRRSRSYGYSDVEGLLCSRLLVEVTNMIPPRTLFWTCVVGCLMWWGIIKGCIALWRLAFGE
jgi:hypothetical protein